jgi:hypothetical protein
MLQNLRAKKVTILGKSIPAIAIALLLIGGLASAGLLNYYGMITGTATVKQSVTLDGMQCTGPNGEGCTVSDGIGTLTPGGERFCFEHHLKNDASVPAKVNLGLTGCTPDCVGVTTTYNNLFAKETFDSLGDVHAKIYKEDWSEDILWTFNITDPSDHYGVGLVINGDSDNTPEFQVYFAEFGDKEWHYQDYGQDLGGPYCGWETGIDVVCPGGVCFNGIVATGSETGNIFTIKIPKNKLGYNGATFGWASQVRTTLLGKYPDWTPWCGFVWETESTVGSPFTPPITLAPEEIKDFYTCYGFAINIAPGTYTMTTGIVPVLA